MPGKVMLEVGSRGARKRSTKRRSSNQPTGAAGRKDGALPALPQRARPFLPPALPPPAHNSERVVEFEPVPVTGGKGPLIRNRIGSQALDLFAANGFEGTSTREIAQRLGIRHSLLLYHFGSKLSLWQYVTAGMVKLFRAAVAARMPATPRHDPQLALRVAIDALVDFDSEFPQFHKIMMIESAQPGERLRWLVVNQLQPHYESMMELILAGQKRGVVRPLEPARLYYTVIGVVGMLSSAAPTIEQLTGLQVFSPAQRKQTKEFIAALVFPEARPPA